LIGDGLTNRQIGERMFLAEKTVKNYVSSLFAKLGIQRRTQSAARCTSTLASARQANLARHAAAAVRNLLGRSGLGPAPPTACPSLLGTGPGTNAPTTGRPGREFCARDRTNRP